MIFCKQPPSIHKNSLLGQRGATVRERNREPVSGPAAGDAQPRDTAGEAARHRTVAHHRPRATGAQVRRESLLVQRI